MAGILLYAEVHVYSNSVDRDNDNNCEGIYFVLDSEDNKIEDEVKLFCEDLSFKRSLYDKNTHCKCIIKYSVVLDSEEEGGENDE